MPLSFVGFSFSRYVSLFVFVYVFDFCLDSRCSCRVCPKQTKRFATVAVARFEVLMDIVR